MSGASSNPGVPPCISLDSSVLFRIPRAEPSALGEKARRYLPDGEYTLDFYNTMCEMVAAGDLTFPIEVRRESDQQQKTDPERNYDLAVAFTQKAWDSNRRVLRVPAEEHVRNVVNRGFGRDVSLESERKADPYVIAIALTQRAHERDCFVATEDRKMIRCCEDLGIRVLNTREFITSVITWRDCQESLS